MKDSLREQGMPTFKNRFKHVNTRLYSRAHDNLFPELAGLGDKAKMGICFSGGGSRSASCTHGQLRALNELGLLENIGYVSCVSGGSWAALPYTYLDKHYNDDHFFGSSLEPKALSNEVLETVSDTNFLQTVTNAIVLDDIFKQWAIFAGDETYSRAIGNIFLERFGLNDRSKVFASNITHLHDVLERNEHLLPNDFYLPKEGRPFLIVSAAFLRPGKGDYIFEMTPWYSGVSELYENAGSLGTCDIGGGYIESFAFDSDAPKSLNSDNTVNVRLGRKNRRFTLSDVIGTSGAAPAEVFNNLGIKFIGFPEFKHWPINDTIGSTPSKEYEISDGGNIENLGIMPLLKRGVEHIIVFVNTKRKIYENGNKTINDAVTSLFEEGNINQIFEPSALKTLVDNLKDRLAQGEATIYQGTYDILENAHHGIKGGRQVEILWVYNNIYKRWKRELPDDVEYQIGVSGKLANFPHFATFGENFGKAIDMHPIQANLLSQMSSAVIHDNKEKFTALIHQ